MTEPTPIHELAAKWRSDANEICPYLPGTVTTGSVTALARAATFRICADQLEASLAAMKETHPCGVPELDRMKQAEDEVKQERGA